MAILVSNVVAYIVLNKSKEVYLSISGDKKHNTKVKKLIDSPFSELDLGQNEFTLELNVPGYYTEGAYISSPKFPKSEKYKVMNFEYESAPYILSEVENKKGVFNDKKFEAVFSDSDLKVSFVCSDMSCYKKLLEEMTRKFYAEIGKKTRKWVPGHRYDCTEATYFYLGSFLSRKQDEFNSDFYKSGLKQVHLFTNSLRPGETKISDVFKNRCFNTYDLDEDKDRDSIKVLWDDKFPSCVDSGKKLEDDTPSLADLYETMIDNAVNSINIDEGLDDRDIKVIFDPLCYVSLTDTYIYSQEISNKVKSILTKIIKDTVYRNWDIKKSREDRRVGKDVDFGDNVDRLVHLVLSQLSDGNVLGKYYYMHLFQELGLDISKEISEYLNIWEPSELSENFNTYLENIDYFKRRSQRIVINQLVGDASVDSVFGSSELSNTIRDLVNYANINYGDGVTVYRIDECNKKQTNIFCLISINDLIKFKDSEKLKEELLSFKFTEVSVYFDKDKKLI